MPTPPPLPKRAVSLEADPPVPTHGPAELVVGIVFVTLAGVYLNFADVSAQPRSEVALYLATAIAWGSFSLLALTQTKWPRAGSLRYITIAVAVAVSVLTVVSLLLVAQSIWQSGLTFISVDPEEVKSLRTGRQMRAVLFLMFLPVFGLLAVIVGFGTAAVAAGAYAQEAWDKLYFIRLHWLGPGGLSGEIENGSAVPLRDVEYRVTLYDDEEHVVARIREPLRIRHLLPGERAIFAVKKSEAKYSSFVYGFARRGRSVPFVNLEDEAYRAALERRELG